MPATKTLQSTILKEGPLELWEHGSRSWVQRHVEVCLRTPDEPDERDVCCLAYRHRPARRELGHAELQSSFLCEAEHPDSGETLPCVPATCSSFCVYGLAHVATHQHAP